MRQIIQSYRTGELWLEDVPAPALQKGGAIVRTAASVVSAGTERMIIEMARKSLLGKARARPDLARRVVQKVKTDGLVPTLEKVFSKLDTPIPLGYSCAGTVVEVGADVSGLKAGDRVACAGAGYATHSDYNYVPRNLLAKVPDTVSFDDAAFTTLGAIAMQGVRQADLRLGERVVVIGLGLLGLLTVQLLKASGCAVLGTDPDVSKCRLAEDLGADQVAATDLEYTAAAFTDGQGADAVIITAATDSSGPVEQAAEISRQRGRVVVVGLVGMNVPRDPFYRKELDLRLSMSYGPGRYDPSYEEGGHDYPFGYVRWTEQRNMQSFLDLMAAGRVMPKRLVTHRFDIGDALKAYELLQSRRERYLGILIEYAHEGLSDEPRVPPRVVELRSVQSDRRVGIGLIGAGNYAKGVLIPALKRTLSTGDADLVGLCTATGMSAAQTAKKYKFAYATTDYAKLLSDERVQAVFIATRHDSHARFACDALKAGKHVFVEKPLCIREDELAAYEDAVLVDNPMRPLLMVGFNRRFSPHAIRVREAFATRTTPMVVTYRVNAGEVPRESWTHSKEVGGGRVIGEACHFLDLCEFLINSEPVSVHADCVITNDVRLGNEDSSVISIRYADGSIASIQYIALGSRELPKERIEVFADHAVAVIEDFSRTTFYGLNRRPVKTRQDKGVDAQLRAFLTAVRAGGEPPISFASMVRTTRLTFQIHESFRSGKAVARNNSAVTGNESGSLL